MWDDSDTAEWGKCRSVSGISPIWARFIISQPGMLFAELLNGNILDFFDLHFGRLAFVSAFLVNLNRFLNRADQIGVDLFEGFDIDDAAFGFFLHIPSPAVSLG